MRKVLLHRRQWDHPRCARANQGQRRREEGTASGRPRAGDNRGVRGNMLAAGTWQGKSDVRQCLTRKFPRTPRFWKADETGMSAAEDGPARLGCRYSWGRSDVRQIVVSSMPPGSVFRLEKRRTKTMRGESVRRAGCRYSWGRSDVRQIRYPTPIGPPLKKWMLCCARDCMITTPRRRRR